MTKGRRRLCYELHNSYSSTKTLRAITTTPIIWAKHAARDAGTLNSYGSFPPKSFERRHSTDNPRRR